MNFETFWSAYPRKVSKGAAMKAWGKLNPDSELSAAIVHAVEAQKRYRSRVTKANDMLPKWKQKFIPDWKHPSTWLNQQCWLDEVEDEVSRQPKAKAPNYCADCQKEEGRYPVNGIRYCIRCYDKHAHPELQRV